MARSDPSNPTPQVHHQLSRQQREGSCCATASPDPRNKYVCFQCWGEGEKRLLRSYHTKKGGPGTSEKRKSIRNMLQYWMSQLSLSLFSALIHGSTFYWRIYQRTWSTCEFGIPQKTRRMNFGASKTKTEFVERHRSIHHTEQTIFVLHSFVLKGSGDV